MDLAELITVVTVEPVGPDHFVGRSPADRTRPVYGGQFLAQAVMAAGGTVEPGRAPHSLHGYFVRAGAAQIPIDYRVERVRDGRSFSHRSVVATQDDREVFRLIISFQVPTVGLSHQEPFEMASGLDPSTFPSYRHWVEELSDNRAHDWFREDIPVDIRFENAPPPRPRAPVAGVLRIWMRLIGPQADGQQVDGQQVDGPARSPDAVPSDDPVLHAALLAWISDKTISDVTMYPHGRSWTDAGCDVVSLDHTMHFFQPSRADRWTLFTHETPATGGGRGLARGDIVALDGRRVGSLSQEALMVVPAEHIPG